MRSEGSLSVKPMETPLRIRIVSLCQSLPSRAEIFLLIIIAVVGIALRIHESLRITSLMHPDEIFQTLEPAHRLAYGYGVITWEWRDGIRSWLLPGLLAVAMRCTESIGRGSVGYLLSIRILLSLISMGTVWLGYVWAKRVGGTACAIASATGCAIWFEMVAFAPRAMPEALAAQFLLAGMYLGCYRGNGSNARRLLYAGLLCGTAASLRIQLLPVVVYSIFLFCRHNIKTRLPIVLGGVLLSISVFGFVDFVTWHHPFQSMYLYFWENAVLGKSLLYGGEPWYWYLLELANHLGPILLFAVIGMGRAPFLGWAALIVLATHCMVPHKEMRFLYPMLPILLILSSLGLSVVFEELKLLLHAPWVQNLYVPVSIAFFLISSYSLSTQSLYWDDNAGPMSYFISLSKDKRVCGIGLYSVPWYETGGYTYLHQAIPVSLVQTLVDFEQDKTAFNVVIANGHSVLPSEDFVLESCRDKVCLYRRPGNCSGHSKDEINRVLADTGN
jgi:GPI mannosyltransferase 3